MTTPPGDDGSKQTIHDVFEDVTTDTNTIFDNKELLQIDYVPNQDRIVGRDDQIEQVASEIAPIILANQPNSAVIYGKTGCGKSLVAKHVSQIAQEEAENRGYNIAIGYVNCQQLKSNVDVLRDYGTQINPSNSTVKFPSRGISEGEYYDRLWDVLTEYYDGAMIVLDEVDKLKNDDILMILSRAGETGSVDVPIGVIAVSNKLSFKDDMTERTKSSFGHNEFIFDSYDATQIAEILRNRKDAFADGVLQDGVIELTAALSAQEHGDARKAVRLLRYAGEVAISRGKQAVKEAHIEAARDAAESERLLELLSGLPSHTNYILLAIANLTNNNPDKQWFRTRAIKEKYNEICEMEGIDPLKRERHRELLSELCFLEVISDRPGEDGIGHYTQYSLIWDVDIVLSLETKV